MSVWMGSVVNGLAQRANLSGEDYYRTFTRRAAFVTNLTAKRRHTAGSPASVAWQPHR